MEKRTTPPSPSAESQLEPGTLLGSGPIVTRHGERVFETGRSFRLPHDDVSLLGFNSRGRMADIEEHFDDGEPVILNPPEKQSKSRSDPEDEPEVVARAIVCDTSLLDILGIQHPSVHRFFLRGIELNRR